MEWFTVISSAPGTQGYVTADEENAYVKEVHATPTAVLLDPEGDAEDVDVEDYH